MDDIKILDTVERYIRGEMSPDERLYFEQLRKTIPRSINWWWNTHCCCSK